MATKRSLSVLLAGAALLGGCASGPHARLEGTPYLQTSLHTYPLIITAIDGASTGIHVPVLAEPGRREIRVQGLPSFAQSRGATRTVSLDLAPCTRYWLVAVKPLPLTSAFDVKVDHSEPIAGCAVPKS